MVNNMKNAIEQVRPAETPGEMRAEIIRMQLHDALVRKVMEMAKYSGMNSEDMYTVLAYHALRAKCEAQAQAYEFAIRSLPQPVVFVKGGIVVPPKIDLLLKEENHDI
jgi:hypothetical protein